MNSAESRREGPLGGLGIEYVRGILHGWPGHFSIWLRICQHTLKSLEAMAEKGRMDKREPD